MGNVVNLKCSEISIPEFPTVLFGTTSDGVRMFDATFYISSKQPTTKDIISFQKSCETQIEAILGAYDINIKDAFCLNQEGHVLIDCTLCYIFIAYIEPEFCVWINERINELMSAGTAVSDTFLAKSIVSRFSLEDVTKTYKHYGAESGK